MYCPRCGRETQITQTYCSNCGQALLPIIPSPGIPSQPQVMQASLYEPSSIGKRFGNYFLDYFFQMIFTGILAGIAITADSSGAFILLVMFSGLIYYLLFEGIWQRTPGKWITGTKVVMSDGSKPEFGTIFLRTLIRIIPFEPLSFFFNPIGWHDAWSKTLVVPASYTPEMIQQIKHNPAKGLKNTWLIIVVVLVFIIAIFGIMSAVILTSLSSSRIKANDAKRVADISQIQSGLELYYSDYHVYPEDLATLYGLGYVDEIDAPTPPDGQCSEEDNVYQYFRESTDFYYLSFCLGSSTGGFDAGLNEVVPIEPSYN